MVARRFAHCVHVLRPAGQQQRSDCANLRLFHADESPGFLATLQGHKFVTLLVARWFTAHVHVEHAWKSGTVYLGCFRPAPEAPHFFEWGKYISVLESQDGPASRLCQ